MQSISASGYNSITVRRTFWPIQHQPILICFTLLTHLIPTLLATNSFLFGNTSTSLIWTNSFTVRSSFLLSNQQTEEPGQNQSNRMGYSEIPLSSLSQPPSAFWCADLFHSCWCRCPHYILLCRFSICTLTVDTTRTSQTPKLADLPLAKGIWFCYCPQFFSFLYITFWAPSGCDDWLLHDSMKILSFTFHVSIGTKVDCSDWSCCFSA